MAILCSNIPVRINELTDFVSIASLYKDIYVGDMLEIWKLKHIHIVGNVSTQMLLVCSENFTVEIVW